jgi:hypothetical protein
MGANGSQSTCYHNNLPSVSSWVAALENKVANIDLVRPRSWILMMLKIERHDRCSAQSLFDVIHESSRDPNARLSFVGLCCIEEEESDESVQSSIFDPEARERATETTTVSSVTSHAVPGISRAVVEVPSAVESLTVLAGGLSPPAGLNYQGENGLGNDNAQMVYNASKSAENQALKTFWVNTADRSKHYDPEGSHESNEAKTETYVDQELHLPEFRWWWHNEFGRQKAALVRWNENEVRLRVPSGKVITLQLAELSIGDNAYLRTQTCYFMIPTVVPPSHPLSSGHLFSNTIRKEDRPVEQFPSINAELEKYSRSSRPKSWQALILQQTTPAIDLVHQPREPSPLLQHASSQVASMTTDILTTLSIKSKDHFIPQYITSTARSEYDDLFDLGTLGANNVMLSSRFEQLFDGCGVSKDDLGRIWDLVDENHTGKLNLNGFAVAVHLIYRRLDSHPVPAILEPDMQSVLDGEVWCNRAGNKEPPKYWTAESFNLTPITRPPLPPRNRTTSPATPLAPVAGTPVPVLASTQPTDQSADQLSVPIVEKSGEDHNNEITPETKIKLRVTVDGRTTRSTIKYADVSYKQIEEHLRTTLCWPYKNMNIVLERRSYSKGTYIPLPPEPKKNDEFLWKETRRAARVGRKLALRVFFNPAPPSSPTL